MPEGFLKTGDWWPTWQLLPEGKVSQTIFLEGWGFLCVDHKVVRLLFLSDLSVQHSGWAIMTHWLDCISYRVHHEIFPGEAYLYPSDNRPPPVSRWFKLSLCWSQLKLNGRRIGALEITISCSNVKLLCWADPHVLQKNPSLDLSAGMACERGKCSGWRIITVLVKP